MKKRRPYGFTLVEVLVVLVIVAILVSLMTPAILSAKRSGQITSAVQKLRQLHVALELYRQDHASGGNGYYALGLAPAPYFFNTRFGFDAQSILSPCGFDETLFETGPNNFPGWVSYTAPFYDPINLGPRTNVPLHHYLENYKDNAVAFVDCYCNPHGTSMSDKSKVKRGIAVTLGGQLINRQRTGDGFLLQFYSDPPDQ